VLFAFRGIRLFQVILSVTALACGVGAVVVIKAVSDGNTPKPMVAVAVLLGLVFLWAFGTTLRAPTSYVAVAPERTRIRFAGFVDTVVDNKDILGVTLHSRPFIAGLGVRTNFSGDVALLSAPGTAAVLTLRKPVRIWLVPKLIPLKAQRLTLSIRNPEKLAERFGPPPTASQPTSAARKMKNRGPRTR